MPKTGAPPLGLIPTKMSARSLLPIHWWGGFSSTDTLPRPWRLPGIG